MFYTVLVTDKYVYKIDDFIFTVSITIKLMTVK